MDTGPNAEVSYTIAPTNSAKDSNLFSIDSRSGIVSLQKKLDREDMQEHHITVIARDNAKPPEKVLQSNASLVVYVLDDNDNHPEFQRRVYNFEIDEDKSKGEIGKRLLIRLKKLIDLYYIKNRNGESL